MADGTKIEWTDATWNPITGCTVVSPGCTNCYAMKLAGTRMKHHPSRAGLTIETKNGPVWNGMLRFNEQWLDQPLRWRTSRMIFVCAHGDLFHEEVPDEWVDRIFAVMALCPQHTFQVLTKRPERMRRYMQPFDQRRSDSLGGFVLDIGYDGPLECLKWPLPNVWLGVSCENQEWADARREPMRRLAGEGWLTWVSYEPALGLVRWDGWEFIRWLVSGGESGQRARPSHLDWHRAARDWCEPRGIPYHFKQCGDWQEYYDRDRDDPDCQQCPRCDAPGERYVNLEGGFGFHGERVVAMRRVGKGAAGRLLDGVEHNGFPQMRETRFG